MSYHAAFLDGQSTAQKYGVSWLTSGSRPDEIHGPFCQVFRNVLNLTPDGSATACFKSNRTVELESLGLQLGGWRDEDQCFEVDVALVNSVRQQLKKEWDKCELCLTGITVPGCALIIVYLKMN